MKRAYRWIGGLSILVLLTASCSRWDVNQRCCESEYEIITQHFKISEDYTLYIPQVFTPNKDGLNDQFYPIGTGWKLNKLVVKKGLSKVYESTSHLDAFWDGGTERDGQYKYTMTFKSDMNDIFIVEGDVCVMRLGTIGDRLPEIEREKICDCVTFDMLDSLEGPINKTSECPQNGRI